MNHKPVVFPGFCCHNFHYFSFSRMKWVQTNRNVNLNEKNKNKLMNKESCGMNMWRKKLKMQNEIKRRRKRLRRWTAVNLQLYVIVVIHIMELWRKYGKLLNIGYMWTWTGCEKNNNKNASMLNGATHILWFYFERRRKIGNKATTTRSNKRKKDNWMNCMWIFCMN